MCILFFAIEQHPDFPVIICANRDEFHQRPTQAMHHWQQPNILAGKDLQAGGTWLGLDAQGNFSALTNFRQVDKLDKNKKSRGDLVISALDSHNEGHSTLETKNTLATNHTNFTQYLHKSAEQYNGYNLVYGALDKLQCFDSINKSEHHINKGFHSICNGALDDIWPKMALGQKSLEQVILANKSLDIEQLFSLMKNQQQASPEKLPDTGLTPDWEQLLSAIFIVSPDYGTRTTNIITLANNGEISVYDRSYNPAGEVTHQQSFLIPKR